MLHADLPKALRGGAITIAVMTALLASVDAAGVATATPTDVQSVTAAAAPAADGSHLDRVVPGVGNAMDVYVYSAAMKKTIQLKVLRPADTRKPAPTLYLLNGAGGGEELPGDWLDHTDITTFMADKDVNVVIPIGGRESYYTDWLRADPVLGLNKWTTFLTKELPPVIDSTLRTTKKNALAGLSMSGTSVLALAESAPGLYKSVGAYSGCASTSDPLGAAYVIGVVNSRGGGDVENMWGPVGGPEWTANDPYVNADKLRGTELYISAGTGGIGPHDNMQGRNVGGDPNVLVQQVTFGGVLEAAVNQCTRNLQQKLEELNIPATYNFRPNGTHSWDYWQDDLHSSWPVIAKSLGL